VVVAVTVVAAHVAADGCRAGLVARRGGDLLGWRALERLRDEAPAVWRGRVADVAVAMLAGVGADVWALPRPVASPRASAANVALLRALAGAGAAAGCELLWLPEGAYAGRSLAGVPRELVNRPHADGRALGPVHLRRAWSVAGAAVAAAERRGAAGRVMARVGGRIVVGRGCWGPLPGCWWGWA
jgi:hypothetical protein